MKLTLADIRKHHTGTWFLNSVPSKGTRIIGNLRKNRYILTQECTAPFFWVWGVYDIPGDYRITLLSKFSSKDLALAEIGSPAIEELYSLNKPRV
jgi:hypothetical protein